MAEKSWKSWKINIISYFWLVTSDTISSFETNRTREKTKTTVSKHFHLATDFRTFVGSCNIRKLMTTFELFFTFYFQIQIWIEQIFEEIILICNRFHKLAHFAITNNSQKIWSFWLDNALEVEKENYFYFFPLPVKLILFNPLSLFSIKMHIFKAHR